MNGEAFIDTNIWVYAHLESPVDGRWRVARELTEYRTGFTVSTQVLNEYYAAMPERDRGIYPSLTFHQSLNPWLRLTTLKPYGWGNMLRPSHEPEKIDSRSR